MPRLCELYPGICLKTEEKGWHSAVRIVTHYGLDGPELSEIFLICLARPWGPPSLLYNGYWVFLVGKAAGAWR
jgi:hypothetical protein